jgi:hypothetical protein
MEERKLRARRRNIVVSKVECVPTEYATRQAKKMKVWTVHWQPSGGGVVVVENHAI